MRALHCLVPLFLLPACLTSRSTVLGAPPTTAGDMGRDYEVLGPVFGEGEAQQFALLPTPAADSGRLLAEGDQELLPPHTFGIRWLDQGLDVVFGSDHLIEPARRAAVFHALESQPDADAVLFPRYEIKQSELILVPGLASAVTVTFWGTAVRWKAPAPAAGQ